MKAFSIISHQKLNRFLQKIWKNLKPDKLSILKSSHNASKNLETFLFSSKSGHTISSYRFRKINHPCSRNKFSRNNFGADLQGFELLPFAVPTESSWKASSICLKLLSNCGRWARRMCRSFMTVCSRHVPCCWSHCLLRFLLVSVLP